MNASTCDPLIIIGTGLAGISLAKAWRRHEPERALILITQDDGHFYSKPQLSTALQNSKTPDELVVTPKEMLAEQLRAEFITHSIVEAIDTAQKQITVSTPSGQRVLTYGQCVLATGAQPKQLNMLAESKRTHYINSLCDYRSFYTTASQEAPLAIIGSGLVGCELAYDLAHSFKARVMITRDPYPLSHLIPRPMGIALQKTLEQTGLDFHTADILALNESAQGATIALSSGKTLQCGTILSAIGLSPNIALARDAGIPTREGIIVNTYLETQVPNIFALGDAAEIDGRCRQFVAPILRSAEALAQTLCGNPTALNLPTVPIVLKIKDYPIVVCPPPFNTPHHCELTEEGLSVRALFLNDEGEQLGFALSGQFVSERQQWVASQGTRVLVGA